MNSPESTQVRVATPVAAVLAAGAATQVVEHPAPMNRPGSPENAPKRAGYGLPCSKCKAYYAADLAACPVCKNTERVSPVIGSVSAAAQLHETLPDPAVLEEERERFLSEFKAQVFATPLQINASTNLHCVKNENHQGGFEAAEICQGCYEHLQERVDVLEGALHMDLAEAAQVIYDAVWADPSDPSKTYQNAASALLTELRRRSGITQVFGPLAPLPD